MTLYCDSCGKSCGGTRMYSPFVCLYCEEGHRPVDPTQVVANRMREIHGDAGSEATSRMFYAIASEIERLDAMLTARDGGGE